MKRLTAWVLTSFAIAAGRSSSLFASAKSTAIPTCRSSRRRIGRGWQLAVDEINRARGLLGRKVEVIARDDAGRPEEALRHAVELTSNAKVDVLAGIPVQCGPGLGGPCAQEPQTLCCQ